jgi:5-methylcytosine-specific restriction protein B
METISLNANGNGLARRYEKGNAIGFEIPKNSGIGDADFTLLLQHLARRLELMPDLSETSLGNTASDELDGFIAVTNWSATAAAKVLASLSDKSPQVVLQGPPGTGKTFVAMELAKYILGPLDEESAKDQIQIVQFHPSYGYEEFVEGLRPETNEAGNLQFAKVEGSLLRLANKSKQDGKPRVLIIDEMNRANLPKVFGELMFLLEYRNKEISLMYHGNFSLPSNLYIIGTMNTADRSIKSMDIALRRRFDFFDVKPSVEILKAHYKTRSNQLGNALFQGFEKLNARIEQDMGGSNYAVGHSYFMMDEIKKSDLRDVWDLQIFPLLEDYFFDRPELAKEYTFDAFWS